MRVKCDRFSLKGRQSGYASLITPLSDKASIDEVMK